MVEAVIVARILIAQERVLGGHYLVPALPPGPGQGDSHD